MLNLDFATLYASMLLVFSSLLPVINPFGGAMFFLSMTNSLEHKARKKLALKVSLCSLVTLLVCLYAGSFILRFFGISIPVLRVAGGIVLFSVGWNLLNEPTSEEQTVKAKPKTEQALFDMAFYPFTLPLTVGPGAISVTVAFGAAPMGGLEAMIGCLLGLLLNCVVIWFCYTNSDKITRSLGVAGADALTRIFSFILICIGVSIFWTGFSGLWATLPR